MLRKKRGHEKEVRIVLAIHAVVNAICSGVRGAKKPAAQRIGPNPGALQMKIS